MPETRTQPETQPETPEAPATRNQCRHIQSSGHRCASPSLRRENFCYYHHSTRAAISKSEAQSRQGLRAVFTPLEPDTRTAIQLNLGEIMRRLAAHELDPKRAGLLLYALQIAASNLPKPVPQTVQTIEDIVDDDVHGPLAPVAEFEAPGHEKSLEQILLEQWRKDDEDEASAAARSAAAAADAAADAAAPPPEDWDDLRRPLTLRACAASSAASSSRASSSQLKSSKLTARETRPAPAGLTPYPLPLTPYP